MSPERSLDRRAFLHAALSLIGSLPLAAAATLLSGCGAPSDPELGRRLVASLRSLLAGAAPGFELGGAAPSRDAALATLCGDLSAFRLRALTWSDALLRRHVDDLRRADLADGRTRLVDGWILAESEIAIAALLER